jgi:superkiller protein 3
MVVFLVLLGSGIGWAVRDRSARQAKVAAQVELILREVEQLERDQKWAEALIAVRRADAVVAGGEADVRSAGRVHERVRDLEFIDRLEQIHMQSATWIEGKFDKAGAARSYARAFREYGVDVESLAVETSIERLKAQPPLPVPAAAALDLWARFIYAKDDDASSKRLAAIAHGIDPEPLRDRLRFTYDAKSASDLRDEIRRLAESINIHAHPPATIDRLADALGVEHADLEIRLRRDALLVYPADFWLNFNLAHDLEEQKDHEGAIRFYSAAVAIRPHAVAALNNLGIVLNELKRRDEAVAVHRKSIEIDPRFEFGYTNLGRALGNQGKRDEALSCYRKAIEINPKSASAYVNLGLTLRSYGENLDAAVAAFRKAIEIDPKNAYAHTELGLVLGRQGKLDEAIAAHRKAIEINPKYVYAHTNLGLALRSQGKLDEAIAAYRKAIESDPKSPWGHNSLAFLLATSPDLKLRDPGLALTHAKIATEIDPANVLFFNTLGTVYYRNGDWKAAIAALEKSMELGEGKDLTNAEAHDHHVNRLFLAMSQWQLGNRDEARRSYDQAIQKMDERATTNRELAGFRVEAAELLGVDPTNQPAASTAPATTQLHAEAARLAFLKQLNGHAYWLRRGGKLEEARRLRLQVIEKAKATYPRGDSTIIEFQRYYVELLHQMQRYEEERDVVLDILAAVGNDKAQQIWGLRRLVSLHNAWQKPHEAEAYRQKLLRLDPTSSWGTTRPSSAPATTRASSTTSDPFRAEAAELLGVDPRNQPAPSTAPATTQPQPPKK